MRYTQHCKWHLIIFGNLIFLLYYVMLLKVQNEKNSTKEYKMHIINF